MNDLIEGFEMVIGSDRDSMSRVFDLVEEFREAGPDRVGQAIRAEWSPDKHEEISELLLRQFLGMLDGYELGKWWIARYDEVNGSSV